MTVVALSGGVGGAKLALASAACCRPRSCWSSPTPATTSSISGCASRPDIDTVMYTLAGLANPELGWGRRDETWSFMETLDALGGETWFRLGDRDLAVHVERTRRLRAGETLSAITADICAPARRRAARAADERRSGAHARCAPTRAGSTSRTISCASAASRWCTRWRSHGAATARAQPDFLAALADPQLTAVVICPSNPFISIEPILAVPGVRDAIAGLRRAGGRGLADHRRRAVKGPTAKMMAELGTPPSAAAVARATATCSTATSCDADMDQAAGIAPGSFRAPTLMTTLDDREALARTVLGRGAMRCAT